MFSIKNLFDRQTVQESPSVAEGFAKDFDVLKQEILRIGKAQGRDRARSAVSLNNKGAPYDDGTKEWVNVKRNALYIRYYDTALKGCESLYSLTLDRDREVFILQRAHEFEDAREAVRVFVNLLEDYADTAFIRALKDSLVEKNIIQYAVDEADAVSEVDDSRADAHKRSVEPLIK